MSKPKPTKPRVVYLIEHFKNPRKFLQVTCTSKKQAEGFRDLYAKGQEVVKFVEVCDE